MLSEMEHYEVMEWRAYFRLKKQQEDVPEKATEAEARARGR
jgi:hypothetical protein